MSDTDKALNIFVTALGQSMAGIDPKYFRIRHAGGTSIPLERPYCYELYHQLRLRQENSSYTINGEVVKGRNDSFMEQYKLCTNDTTFPISDFIVHRQAFPDNLAVIEVKVAKQDGPMNPIQDFKKLRCFTETDGVNYKCGIFLVFGEPEPRIHGLQKQTDRVHVLWHANSGQPVRVLQTRTPGLWPSNLFKLMPSSGRTEGARGNT